MKSVEKFIKFELGKKSSLIFLTFSVLLISFYYRAGGTRDFGLYTKAGEAFLNGENAYVTQLWRSGAFGASVLWLIFGIWPQVLLPFLYQGVTFISFWFFAKFLGLPSNKIFWVFGFTLFLSPVREVINTLQITGLVLGLMTLSISSGPKFLSKFEKSYFVLQAIAMAVALDLKPHSICFVVILLFIKGIKRHVISTAVLIIGLGHTALDLLNGEILEKTWFNSLANLGNASGENGESTSPWKLIGYLSGGKINTNLFSLGAIVVVVIIGVIYREKLDQKSLLYLGLTASTLLTYMHYYDLAPLAVCVLVRYFANPNSAFALATMMFLILPREVGSWPNLVVFISLCFLLLSVTSEQVAFWQIKANHLSKAFLIFSIIHLLNAQLDWDYRLVHALVTSETMMMAILVLLGSIGISKNVSHNKEKSNELEKAK